MKKSKKKDLHGAVVQVSESMQLGYWLLKAPGLKLATAILRRRISTKLAEWMKCVVISAAV